MKNKNKICVKCGHKFLEGNRCGYCYNLANGIYNPVIQSSNDSTIIEHSLLNSNTININTCSICGSTETCKWFIKNDELICSNCNNGRKYTRGILNPKSHPGIAVITEHVTFQVLGDCTKCNTLNNFNFKYDLISESLGIINVKSSIFRPTNSWIFAIREYTYKPDYYICIGFDKYRTKILHVWYIPGTSDKVKSHGIKIKNTFTNLQLVQEYEVNSKIYNDVYKALDIYTLPEFKNYLKL